MWSVQCNKVKNSDNSACFNSVTEVKEAELSLRFARIKAVSAVARNGANSFIITVIIAVIITRHINNVHRTDGLIYNDTIYVNNGDIIASIICYTPHLYIGPQDERVQYRVDFIAFEVAI